jgi:RNA polymerase sigma-70 factor (ECF subfamily)
MAEGDQEAFRFFFDKYYTDLCNFVNIYLHDPMISEEIVQDIFVYFWEKKEKITIDSSVKAYLYRSSKNKSLNYLRNEKRKSGIHEKIRGITDFKAEISDGFLDAGELRELIGKAIGNLPVRTREVFLLGKEKPRIRKYPYIGTKKKFFENFLTCSVFYVFTYFTGRYSF